MAIKRILNRTRTRWAVKNAAGRWDVIGYVDDPAWPIAMIAENQDLGEAKRLLA